MLRFSLLIVVVAACGLARAEPRRANPTLAATLEKMIEEDQREGREAEQGKLSGGGRGRRQALLKQIIAEFGWPTISLVGQRASQAAWLIAQHADDDREFQRTCLALLEKALVARDVDPLDVAYLSDRLAAAEGRPQPYGTQGSAAALYTPAQLLEVNARRKALGLPALAGVATQ